MTGDGASAALLPVSRSTWVVRCNPVAKVVALALLACGVVFSIDLVSASLMLLVALALIPASGVAALTVVKRLWFIPLFALIAGWGTAILATPTGAELLRVGPLVLTEGSLLAGAAITLRSIDLVLPCVLLIASIDSTDLADALVQLWHLPERFVLGFLAASRIMGLLSAELATLRMARRARGAQGRGLVGAVAAVVPLATGLLVQAIRRGARLAMAMEGRGFGTSNRTWSRTSVLTARDWWLIAMAAGLTAVVITVTVLSGQWNFILS